MINKAKLREPIFSTCQLLSIRDKTSICLNMIVKNETGVLKRLFGSVGPFIDYFVIVDTGSNDGTPELILNLATQHRVPGEVHFQKWVNFGHNRQQALEIAIAAAKSKWLLFIDADEELRYTDQHFYRKLKPGVSYKIAKHHGSIRYAVPNLVDISENQWQWQGPAHNYLTHQAGPGLSEHLDTVWIHYHSGQGAKSHGVTSRQKYLRDAALFEAELAKNSNDTRSRFYLAQSYRDAGEPVKALEHYSIRAVLGGWQEEVFYSLYQIAKIKEQLGYADHEVIDAYLAANAAQPKRAEAIHGVARFYRVRKEYEKGYEILKKALDMNPSVDDLFIEPWIYQYGLLDEFSICAYWTARYINCLEACQKILELPDIDPKLRVRIEKNADFARIKLEDDRSKPIVTFPDEVATFVSDVYAKAGCILEYGSGGSTLLASLESGKKIYSIESDQNWATKLKKYFHNSQATSSMPEIIYVDIGPTRDWGFPDNMANYWKFPQYSFNIWLRPDLQAPEVVLIDGRFRVACFLSTALMIKRPTRVLFDDYTDREYYHIVELYAKPSKTVGRMACFDLLPDQLGRRDFSTLMQFSLDPR